jgi:hypothetical protein
MFELKSLQRDAVPAAHEKAHLYRLLNEPRLAESICKDILAVEPGRRETMVSLILALIDQLDDAYSRDYYRGIIHERWAKGHVAARGPASGYIAYDWFRKAMAYYEKAEALRPAGNDDAILRWNTCARVIDGDPSIRPSPHEPAHTMLE